MQRQLPQITQRLQITLDKLSNKPTTQAVGTKAVGWWEALRQRFAHENIAFADAGISADDTVPAELFESIAENLLQNAFEKRKVARNLAIAVNLARDAEGVTLSVCDDGNPVPAEVEQRLFDAPVKSRTGLGVGLYQAARFAREHGYELRLAANGPGRVCFQLAPRRKS
jgi:signal transduction histidine kinase